MLLLQETGSVRWGGTLNYFCNFSKSKTAPKTNKEKLGWRAFSQAAAGRPVGVPATVSRPTCLLALSSAASALGACLHGWAPACEQCNLSFFLYLFIWLLRA